MATHKGSSGVVKIAVNDGSVAAVGEVRSFSIDETADTIEDTVMGDSVKSYLGSLKDATLTIDALWDDLDAQQLVLDTAVDIDWEIHPTGTGSGEKYYAGGGLVTAKTISASYDGLVEASFSIQCSGAITEAAN
jgi:hypothetical protein